MNVNRNNPLSSSRASNKDSSTPERLPPASVYHISEISSTNNTNIFKLVKIKFINGNIKTINHQLDNSFHFVVAFVTQSFLVDDLCIYCLHVCPNFCRC